MFALQEFDSSSNHTDTDICQAMSTLAYELIHFFTSWNSPGRLYMTLVLCTAMLEDGRIPGPVLNTMKKRPPEVTRYANVKLMDGDYTEDTSL